jgi:putative ABC transport system ATP-binding protein
MIARRKSKANSVQLDAFSRGGFFAYVWRHSRREQIVVLLLVLGSLPFYWVSLDIPKRIVNDAIQGKAFASGAATVNAFKFVVTLPDFLGGGSYTILDGFMLAQFPYLLALSLLFLFFTLVNGAFKYVINVRKGILGERMLRRLRFELFSMVMRFRPEDIKATKSAEIASMLKDEVEPIGGFFGEAVITPAFLIMQAVTALLFIMTQNVLLGLLAGGIIAIQGLVIPKLRREQLRLGRQRQIASRKLAGRVSEMVDAAPMLHNHNLVPYFGAEIGDRLANLFDIRMRLFRRKFSVKYLNNLLAQVTPFIFYTLGGYLALNGRLDIGQLVAVIAAYRDLPAPIKELIDWDQQRADVIIKFDQIVGAFSNDLMPEPANVENEVLPTTSPVRISGLRVTNARGIVQLELPSLTIARPVHLALVGPQGSGRDMLPKVIGRQVTDFIGTITVGDRPLNGISDAGGSRDLLYIGSDPYVMSGSIFENICISARRKTPVFLGESSEADEQSRRLRMEAERTGNPLTSCSQDWIDYALLGVESEEQLDTAVIEALRAVHGYDSVFQAGMSGRVGPYISEEIEARIVAARAAIREKLDARGLTSLIEAFAPQRYNSLSTIGENLLFGVATGGRFQAEVIARDSYVRAILEAESLTEPLIGIGTRMLETVIDVFEELPAGSPLFERYSFIDPSESETLSDFMRQIRKPGRAGLTEKARERLIGYSLMYNEPRHRLNLMDELLQARILRARASFRQFLSAQTTDEIEFYDQERVITSAPIRDNLLFGRVVYGIAGSRRKVEEVISETLREQDLEAFVIRQGLTQEAGPGGRLLTPDQRALIPLARALLVKPGMVIVDNALTNFSANDQQEIIAALRKNLVGSSLIVTLSDEESAGDFDRMLVFSGKRIVEDRDMKAVHPGQLQEHALAG